MFRTARISSNILTFSGITKKSAKLYSSSFTFKHSSCIQQTSHRFIFKRWITNQRQNDTQQDVCPSQDEHVQDNHLLQKKRIMHNKHVHNKRVHNKRAHNKHMRNKQMWSEQMRKKTIETNTSQPHISESQTTQTQDNKHRLDTSEQSPSLTTKLLRSYCLPFTVISGTFGFALTYATDNPVFILCSIPLGICGGMLRDKNAKMQNDKYLSAGVKLVSIYVLGPPVLLCGIGLFVLMATKM